MGETKLKDCWICSGEGHINSHECYRCGGTGKRTVRPDNEVSDEWPERDNYEVMNQIEVNYGNDSSRT